MNHVLCSDTKHPVYPMLEKWCSEFVLFNDKSLLTGGENLFLVSCTQYIEKELRELYKNVWVIHESDLPKGRGWSPLAWQILEGKNEIEVSILECSEKIDSGRVLRKETLKLDGSELSDEIQEKLFEVKKSLISFAMTEPKEQVGEPTYYNRRTPEDSRLDVNASIESQFDLLRICEPRFPAFFDIRGHRYELTIRKL